MTNCTEKNPKINPHMNAKEFHLIAEMLKSLEKKLGSKQEYRHVMEVNPEKEIYIGMTIELLSKEEFEKEYMPENDNA